MKPSLWSCGGIKGGEEPRGERENGGKWAVIPLLCSTESYLSAPAEVTTCRCFSLPFAKLNSPEVENAVDSLSVIQCASHSPSRAQAEEGHFEEGRRRRKGEVGCAPLHHFYARAFGQKVWISAPGDVNGSLQPRLVSRQIYIYSIDIDI